MEKENIKRKCVICSRVLVAIGNDRSNGKYHDDWSTRVAHKKCWVNANSIELKKIKDEQKKL